MPRILVPALVLALAGVAAAAEPAAAPAAPAPYATRMLMCDRIVLTWPNATLYPVPEDVVTVVPSAGASGISFFVDRAEGRIVSVETWSSLAGTESTTVLPGTPRIDYVNCQEGATNAGGILVEYYDARDRLP